MILQKEAARNLSATDTAVARSLDRIGEVEVIGVPTSAMKSAYTFKETDGFEVAAGAKDVKMLLVHPSAVIPVIAYDFAELGAQVHCLKENGHILRNLLKMYSSLIRNMLLFSFILKNQPRS